MDEKILKRLGFKSEEEFAEFCGGSVQDFVTEQAAARKELGEKYPKYLLMMRAKRLLKLLSLDAPKPIIENELRLVREAASECGYD